MKLCRFDENRLGLVADDGIRDVSAVLARLPSVTYPFPRHDALIAHLAELRPEIERVAKSAKALPVEKAKLLAPVANPGKIIGCSDHDCRFLSILHLRRIEFDADELRRSVVGVRVFRGLSVRGGRGGGRR